MAIVKEVIIKVDDSDLSGLNNELQKVENNLKDVDQAGEKAADSVDEVAGNGGAIAILDQLTGGLATRMRDVWEATKLFNTSLKGTRAALIATGIGALVVALGAIVVYWDEIKEAVTGVNRALQRQLDLLNQQQGVLDARIKLNDSEIALAKAQGKNVDDLIKKQKELNAEKLKSLKSELAILVTQKENFEERTKGFSLLRALTSERVFGLGLSKKEREDLTEFEKQILDVKTTINDLEKESILFDAQNSKQDPKKRDKVTGLGLSDELKRQEEQRKATQKILDDKLADIITANNKEVDAEIAKNSAIIQSRLDRFKEEKIISDAEKEFREGATQAQTDIVIGFGRFLQQIGEENKALAVTGIIVEQIGSAAKIILATAEANAKAVAASPITLGQPWVGINTASAALGIASGAVAAAKAIQQLGGGGSPDRANLPNQGNGAPSFNVVGTSGQNQIAQAISQDQQPIKAFVVGSEVTTQQSLDRNVVETATIVD